MKNPSPSSPTRLLIITRSLGYGGVERAVVTLAEELLPHDPSLKLRLMEDRVELALPETLSGVFSNPPKLPIPLHNLPYFLAHPIRVTWSALLIQYYILTLRPERVLTTCTHSHFATAFVWLRGAEWLSWIGSDISDGIKRASPRYLSRLIMRWFFSWVYRQPKRTVVPSQGLKHELQRELSLRVENFRVIPNPLNHLPFRTEPDNAKVRPSTVVAVGRLEQIKGFELLLKAAQPWPEVQIALVGDGPDRTRLEALTRDLGMSERVEFTGWVDNPEDYMQRAELVVVPSYREGFCYVLLEALSLGCCVLTSDCPHGPREIVGTSQAAKFFPNGDWRALRTILREMLDDPELRSSLRKKALLCARQFDLDDTVTRYREFLYL